MTTSHLVPSAPVTSSAIASSHDNNTDELIWANDSQTLYTVSSDTDCTGEDSCSFISNDDRHSLHSASPSFHSIYTTEECFIDDRSGGFSKRKYRSLNFTLKRPTWFPSVSFIFDKASLIC